MSNNLRNGVPQATPVEPAPPDADAPPPAGVGWLVAGVFVLIAAGFVIGAVIRMAGKW